MRKIAFPQGEGYPLSRRRVQEVRNQYLELMQSSNSLIM